MKIEIVEAPSLAFLSKDAKEALAKSMYTIAASVASRPLYVSQRTVERVTGLPARDYLRAARSSAFASSKVRRLIMAKTHDVVAWVDSHERRPEPANDEVPDELDDALAAVGGRRVSR